MNNKSYLSRNCNEIQTALTNAFKTLTMNDQLQLNDLLEQLKTCAYKAGEYDTAVSLGMPTDYMASPKAWLERNGKR